MTYILEKALVGAVLGGFVTLLILKEMVVPLETGLLEKVRVALIAPLPEFTHVTLARFEIFVQEGLDGTVTSEGTVK